MKVFGLAGWSGSGKTTLLVRLLPELTRRGISVSTIKHAHHHFDIDRPGKDSFRHREAGARQVLISSARRWVLMTENVDHPEPGPEELIERMAPVDIVMIEGFKSWPHPKLEVFRKEAGNELLCLSDPTIIAIASDVALSDVAVPVIALDDIPAIADFILEYLGLAAPAETGAF